MKDRWNEKLEGHRPRMTGEEERRIWKALLDEKELRKPAWRRFTIPAALGGAAVALLLVVGYVSLTPSEKADVADRARPRDAARAETLLEEKAPPQTPRYEALRKMAEQPKERAGLREIARRPGPSLREEGAGPGEERDEERAEEAGDRTSPEGSRVDLLRREEIAAPSQPKKEAEEAPAPAETAPAEKPSPRTAGMEREPSLLATEREKEAPSVLPEQETARVMATHRGAARDSAAPAADSTGTLSGTVYDRETNQPIPWADVVIQGTSRGGIVRKNGTFTISHVPRGTYTVLVHMIGYGSQTFLGVTIRAGKVTNIHAQLGTEPTVIRSIPIGAEEESDVGSSATAHPIDKEEYKALSITTMTDALAKQPGVTLDGQGRLHVRGSRAGEVKYSTDGVPVTGNVFQEAGRPKKDRDWPISVGGTDPVNGEAFDAMFFEHYGVNPFIDPEEDRFATFAVDVDNASYTMTRSYLNRGELPPKDAVRVEEFVNFFNHRYAPPEEGTFAIHLDAAPSPFGEGYLLLRTGLKGKEVAAEDRNPAVLTFVVDISGSMGREDRLELVKQALYLLLDQMNEKDQVALVVYGNEARTILPHTSLEERERIEEAIASLQPHGSTYAEAGLTEGYLQADRAFRKGWINRVILCSDGVANVGRTGADDILEVIRRKAEVGIEITAIGFGMGNYNDVLMEKLADKGNGNYYYVDDLREAKRVFVENLTGTLQTIARQTKIQVEFEPGTVRSYRILGYENRDVRDEDFRNDRVDAGEVGAGHEVTALFELKLEKEPAGTKIATLRIRYEDPETGKVTEESRAIFRSDVAPAIAAADPRFRIDAAAAEFAEILRHSYWAKEGDLADVYRLARQATRDLSSPEELEELLDLIDRADRLWEREEPRIEE